jgi:AraC family transcriptional regulator, positive regulator of tynA and feaB
VQKPVRDRLRTRTPDAVRAPRAVPSVTRRRRRKCHCERTQRDIRLDGVDHCFAVFQVAGRSTIIQNDQALTLAVGNVAFIDAARPTTYVNHGYEQWIVLQLPRQRLISALGFEPRVGLRGHLRASRLLFQLVVDTVADEEPMPTSADNYMQLALYDQLGALFAPLVPAPASIHSDRLFKRISEVIKDRFADPDFGPYEIAAEVGISLRYLQKTVSEPRLYLPRLHSIFTPRSSCAQHRTARVDEVEPTSE